MRCISFLLLDLMVLTLKILRPGGTKSVIAENLLLRHQLTVIRRSHHRAPKLRTSDRITLGLVSQLINPSRLKSVSIVVQPTTLLNFHRALVKREYRIRLGRRAQKQPGPKGHSRELINAIVELKQRNPRYGCPRIAETITLTFGILVNKDIVRRVLAKHYKSGPGGNNEPSWLTFLGHSKDSLRSRCVGPIDFFRCESLTLNSYWVLVVMDQRSRRIVGFGVHHGSVDGISLCRMFNQATSGADPPCYLSSDNDPLFNFHRWKANLRVLEIEEVKSVPYTPISHPFIERLIGTIRREYLDQIPFWNSLDLQRKLAQFKTYYNEHRTHSAINGLTPGHCGNFSSPGTADINHYRWQSHCNGLFQTPMAA